MANKGAGARKKMRAKWFTVLIGSLLAVLIGVAIALPCVTITYYDGVLRDFFQTAEREAPKGGDADTAALDKTYYKSDYESAAELAAHEKQFMRQIGDEGFVLLKNTQADNKGLPLKTSESNKTTVSLFSHSSVDLVLSGTGSGGGNTKVKIATLKEAFEAQNYKVNDTLWNYYSTGKGSGSEYTRGEGSINYGGSEDYSINEVPLSKLQADGVLSSANGTVPLFVISRTGGEGLDLPRYMGAHTDIAADKTKHYLEPDSVELGIIDYLNKNFDNVIVLVNTNNFMELGWIENYSNITAVLWTPGNGAETADAIVDIVSGNVNASGRIVDTAAYDALSSPAMQNMGDFRYSVDGKLVDEYGVSYDEGVYVGYKYYETRYYDKIMKQGNAGNYDYSSVVQYPFGFGKSYTKFVWSAFEMSEKDADGNITVSVNVKNDGEVAGKDVVQIYVQVPYTDYDIKNHIEKPVVSLVGFQKTELLDAGDDQTVTVTVNVSSFVSYDDVEARTFILENGDYNITAADNAHSAVNNLLAKQGKTVDDGMTENGNKAFVGTWNNPTFDDKTYSVGADGKKITNRFDAANYIDRDKYLSRNDWQGTYPIAHGNQGGSVKSNSSERNGYTYVEDISSTLYEKIRAKGSAEAANCPMTDSEAAALAGTYDNDSDVDLIDVRGMAYDDVDWKILVDQMTVKEVGAILNKSGYCTAKADSISKPYARDLDGPAGLNLITTHAMLTTVYPSEVVIAATWDPDFAYKIGDAIAEDGLTSTNKQFGKVSGWYAPAMNIHRTPFAGRNYEYYSEDPFISGVMASNSVVGAANKGMYSFIKHFALNDQENHRVGICTWSNEQAMREIYFKPFKMAIDSGTVSTKYYARTVGENGVASYELKTAQTPACMAIMSALNRVGYTWAGGDYRLLTQIVRNEWGFNGMIETDYVQGESGYMSTEQMLRAGGDVQLSQQQASYTIKSDAMIYYSKKAMSHVLYCVVNSNAMNGYVHGIQVGDEPFAYYYLILIAVGVVAAGLTAWGVTAIVLRWKKELSVNSGASLAEQQTDSEQGKSAAEHKAE